MIESQRSFYFIRHAETDHNKYKVADGNPDVDINEAGRKQAADVAPKVRDLKISRLYMSPMTRVKSTCKLLFGEHLDAIESNVIPEFTECSHDIWAVLAKWVPDQKSGFTDAAKTFLGQIESGLTLILKAHEPYLIVAHGGTFWALCHHLKIDQDRSINNCVLVRFTEDIDGAWSYTHE